MTEQQSVLRQAGLVYYIVVSAITCRVGKNVSSLTFATLHVAQPSADACTWMSFLCVARRVGQKVRLRYPNGLACCCNKRGIRPPDRPAPPGAAPPPNLHAKWSIGASTVRAYHSSPQSVVGETGSNTEHRSQASTHSTHRADSIWSASTAAPAPASRSPACAGAC